MVAKPRPLLLTRINKQGAAEPSCNQVGLNAVLLLLTVLLERIRKRDGLTKRIFLRWTGEMATQRAVNVSPLAGESGSLFPPLGPSLLGFS